MKKEIEKRKKFYCLKCKHNFVKSILKKNTACLYCGNTDQLNMIQLTSD